MHQTWDIVVVGAGHNGLTAALELASQGRSVLVVEMLERAGGCATTAEPSLPGFRHSPHANTLMFADLMPAAISPESLGVELQRPAAQLGVAFADGRPPVILHRPNLLAETRASLGVYSQADGRTYAQLKSRSEALGPVLRKGLYAPPDPAWFQAQQTAVRSAFKGLVRTSNLGGDTARSLIDALFEAPETRILLYSLATETGVGLEEPGSDLALLGYSLWIAGRWRIPLGGMQVYSDALHRAATAAGVQFTFGTLVSKIVLQDGRAVGVALTDGEVIAAEAVVAATPILHLFDALLDANAISSAEQNEVNAFRRALPSTIGTTTACLDRAPRYRSARHDPAIDACLKTIVGFDTPADVLAQEADIRAGRLPAPAGVVRIHSLWDRSLAPGNKHVASIDSRFPPANVLDDADWRMVEDAFPTALWEIWRRHLVDDGVAEPLAMVCDCSSDFERRMLVRMGPDQYRSSVAGLYLAGPGVYPGGGVHGACGQNAARTLLEDATAVGVADR